ncbi:unnamed protein product, partial [Ectocarpus sp. 4 AP-2014]
KPGQVVESHRRRAVVVWTVSVAAILSCERVDTIRDGLIQSRMYTCVMPVACIDSSRSIAEHSASRVPALAG